MPKLRIPKGARRLLDIYKNRIAIIERMTEESPATVEVLIRFLGSKPTLKGGRIKFRKIRHAEKVQIKPDLEGFNILFVMRMVNYEIQKTGYYTIEPFFNGKPLYEMSERICHFKKGDIIDELSSEFQIAPDRK